MVTQISQGNLMGVTKLIENPLRVLGH